LPQATANTRTGTMYMPVSDELEGQVLGIVGLGASGRELGTRARALGMRVRAVDVAPVGQEDLERLGVEQFDGIDGLDALLAQSDYVSVHVPLTAATRHLIDARRLALMKPTAAIVNVARGAIIDEDALVQALRERTIAGAGIDVFSQEPLAPDNPLLGLDNVIVTPHTAGVTRGTSRRRSRACVENAVRVLGGDEPLYRVHASG
jgi:D-3-phosphoglycerate dehydrogenase